MSAQQSRGPTMGEGAPANLLAFIHVPKTGGTSLQQIFHDNGRRMFHIGHPTQVEAFLALPEAEQAAYFGVMGHMPFGLDRILPRPVTYITFMRDPVDRLLSAYAHNLRHPEEEGANVVRSMGLAWLARPANFVSRFLADYDLRDPADEKTGGYWLTKNAPDYAPRALLDQAKANLERADFIGLQEFYDHDVRALRFLPGQDIQAPEVLPREKTGDNRLKQSDLTEDQLQTIRDANELDVELYQYALALRAARGGPYQDPAINAALREAEAKAKANRAAAEASAPRAPGPGALVERLKARLRRRHA